MIRLPSTTLRIVEHFVQDGPLAVGLGGVLQVAAEVGGHELQAVLLEHVPERGGVGGLDVAETQFDALIAGLGDGLETPWQEVALLVAEGDALAGDVELAHGVDQGRGESVNYR